MSESAPFEKTPEQIAQIKRLAPPIGVASLIIAIAGIVLTLRGYIDTAHPPSVLGASLCFCAMMMAIGILAWAKGAPGIKPILIISLAALLLGAVGPFIYFKRGFDWRIAMEQRELGNVAAIAKAAAQYASDNAGTYPADLAVLLQSKLITPETLHSPYAGTPILKDDVSALRAKLSPKEFAELFEKHTDYSYVGSDLASPPKAPAAPSKDILVAYAKFPVMRMNLAIAFADGSSRFITLEQAEPIMKASNAAREKAGLPLLRPPEAVYRATTQERPQKPAAPN